MKLIFPLLVSGTDKAYFTPRAVVIVILLCFM